MISGHTIPSIGDFRENRVARPARAGAEICIVKRSEFAENTRKDAASRQTARRLVIKFTDELQPLADNS